MTAVWSSHRLMLLRELQLRGTISAVAEALNYASSTVSQQLALLEREVGVPLLRADGRRVRLTPQGERVASHASDVLALEERARAALEVGPPAPVRIAALQTSARALLPRALTMLAASHPDMRIEVSVVPPEEGLFEAEAREFDLVIAEQYPGHTREIRAGLDRVVLGRDPIALAVAPTSSVRSVADARDEAWVMEPDGNGRAHMVGAGVPCRGLRTRCALRRRRSAGAGAADLGRSRGRAAPRAAAVGRRDPRAPDRPPRRTDPGDLHVGARVVGGLAGRAGRAGGLEASLR